MTDLTIGGGKIVREILLIKLRDMLPNDVGHGVHFIIAFSDIFDGVGVVEYFKLFNAAEMLPKIRLATGCEGQDTPFKFVLDLISLVVGNRFEEFLDGNFRRAKGIVWLLRTAG